jgi:hypothetical protein
MAIGAVAGLGFGAVETMVWSKRKNEFDAHTKPVAPGERPPRDCGTTVPGHGGPQCDLIFQQAQTARSLLIVGYAAAGALAVGSAILFIVSSNGDAEPANQALACTPSLYPAGGVCRLTF